MIDLTDDDDPIPEWALKVDNSGVGSDPNTPINLDDPLEVKDHAQPQNGTAASPVESSVEDDFEDLEDPDLEAALANSADALETTLTSADSSPNATARDGTDSCKQRKASPLPSWQEALKNGTQEDRMLLEMLLREQKEREAALAARTYECGICMDDDFKLDDMLTLSWYETAIGHR